MKLRSPRFSLPPSQSRIWCFYFFLGASLLAHSAHGEYQFAPATELVVEGLTPSQPFRGPSLSNDGLTLFLSRSDDIWKAKRLTRFGSFGPLENLGAPVNSTSQDNHPSFAYDESTLFFGSGRPGGLGNLDVYVATRTDDGFGTPLNLGVNVNSADYDSHPFLSADGQTLAFTSTRPSQYGYAKGTFTLYISTWDATTESFGPAIELPQNINRFGGGANSGQLSPSFSPDGSSLFFSAAGPMSVSPDLYVSMKDTEGHWGDPLSLGGNVNTSVVEDQVEFARDGRSIVFVRFENNGDFRLYEARVVPEPGTFALIAMGAAGLLLASRCSHVLA